MVESGWTICECVELRPHYTYERNAHIRSEESLGIECRQTLNWFAASCANISIQFERIIQSQSHAANGPRARPSYLHLFLSFSFSFHFISVSSFKTYFHISRAFRPCPDANAQWERCVSNANEPIGYIVLCIRIRRVFAWCQSTRRWRRCRCCRVITH